MSLSNRDNASEWRFVYFGLIVTGKGEKEFLPDLFRSVAASGRCTFKVICRIGQRGPVTSPKRKLRMLGSGKAVPDRDASEIGLPARGFLSSHDRYVLLVDDLEADRSQVMQEVFGRYRAALDTVLSEDQARRAAVHFFVNMLEAYYFADTRAVNDVLDTELADFAGDVESIRHPKQIEETIAWISRKEPRTSDCKASGCAPHSRSEGRVCILAHDVCVDLRGHRRARGPSRSATGRTVQRGHQVSDILSA